MNKKSIVLFTISLILIIAGCSNKSTSSEKNDKLTIYTSIYPIQYMVERIGDDIVTADTIYPPGTDAHSYEPTAKGMAKIAEGDVFIYLGAGLEAFAQTAADALANEHVKLIELGLHEELFEPVTETDKHEKEDHIHFVDDHGSDNEQEDHDSTNDGHVHGDRDPHIWLDPIRAIQMATIVKEELITLLPEHSGEIKENFETLKSDLNGLDDQFKQVLLNNEQKRILVSHAGYGYWEQRYGVEQIAVSGISSNTEPSQQELIHIIEEAKKYHLNYMIFEQNVSENVAQKIKEEIGATALTFHNLSVLTGKDIENNDDYLSLMRQNIEVLDKATQ